MKEEKMQILWLVGITVSEVLVMAEITFNGTKKKTCSLTFYLPWVTKTEFLHTISLQYQADKWWE